MCRLSVIIPLVGEPERFEDTLVSVLQHRPNACEVLVPHAGPYEDPYDLADEVTFVEVASDAVLPIILNAGCQVAQGDVIHTILPGLRATDGWTSAALDAFTDPRVAAVAPLVMDERRPDRVLVAGIRYTLGGRRIAHGAGCRQDRMSRLIARPISGPWIAAAFYRRPVLEAVGGFGERTHPTWIDVELAMRLKRIGCDSQLVAESLLSSRNRFAASQPSYSAGRSADRVFWRHASDHGFGRAVFQHGMAVSGVTLRHAFRLAAYSDLLGRAISLLDVFDRRRERTRLQQVKMRLCQSTTSDDSPEEPGDSSPEGEHLKANSTHRRVA